MLKMTIPSNSNYIREELLTLINERRVIGLMESHVVGAYVLVRKLGITHDQAMHILRLFFEYVACQQRGPSKFYTPMVHGVVVGKGLIQNFYDFAHMYPEGITEFFKVQSLREEVVQFLQTGQYEFVEELT